MTSAQIAEAQRLAREWDAAHPREPHCTPGPPAVGSTVHPVTLEERRMKPLVAAVAVLVALVAGAPVQAQPPDPLEF